MVELLKERFQKKYTIVYSQGRSNIFRCKEYDVEEQESGYCTLICKWISKGQLFANNKLNLNKTRFSQERVNMKNKKWKRNR
jgi:hypothetical protein